VTSQHSINGRIGALESWAPLQDPAARARRTEKARAGLRARFEREADPDGVMPDHLRARAGEELYRAYMLRLSMAAARSRRLKAGKGGRTVKAANEKKTAKSTGDEAG
jgi:hypothetical protein